VCIIFIAHRTRTDIPVLIAANRDEYYARAARTAHWWSEPANILAGRDKAAGGAWFGVRGDGRFAAVTNLHGPSVAGETPASRGVLVPAILGDAGPLESFALKGALAPHRFKPFNLLYGDAASLYYFNNGELRLETLTPGVYALGNAPLSRPWPKVVAGRRRFGALVKAARPDLEALFDLLTDTQAHQGDLPASSGLTPGRVRALSAIYVEDDDYGTRCSTVYRLAADGTAFFEERTHAGTHEGKAVERFEFAVGEPNDARHSEHR
jgi:uncharacterized protein with NRDE domain